MKYIKKSIIQLNKYVSSLSINNFSRFWNLVFIITNNPLRLNLTENGESILITDNEQSIYISQKIRAWFYFNQSTIDLNLWAKCTFSKKLYLAMMT